MKKISLLICLVMGLHAFQEAGSCTAWTPPATGVGGLAALLLPYCRDDGAPPSDEEALHPMRDIARFYRAFDFEPVWPPGTLPGVDAEMPGRLKTQETPPKPSGASAASHAGSLFSGSIPSPRSPLQPEALPPGLRRDVRITDRIIREARRRIEGYVDPETLPGGWLARRRTRTRDIPIELAQAVKENRIEAFIASLHPDNRAYRALQSALQQYEMLDRSGGFPIIPPGPTMRKGNHGDRVGLLIHRLGITGDLRVAFPTADPGIRYTRTVEAAVKRFQRRHGLRVDGVAGAKTLVELNVPAAKRIEQLRVNMERLRWLPDSLGDRYVVVNIPGFDLRVVEEKATRLHLPAIVGKKSRQTPILSGTMTYLEFNPYWNVPRKIARKDLLPKIIDDPGYLSRQGIRIFEGWDTRAPELSPESIDWTAVSPRDFPYRLRQDPSPQNALGQVKFMFPNHQSVYIHDTPAKRLFSKVRRSFSSGCVRVASPLELAGQLLREQGWNERQLDAVIAEGERKVVILKSAMPVHIVYFTAWVDERGVVQFREDLYGRDRNLSAALNRAGATPIICDGNPTLATPLLAAAHHHTGVTPPPFGP